MALPDFSIVVPVYNEGENIAELLRGIESAVQGDYEILICYDFDEDTTLPAIKALNPPIKNVRLIKNTLGKGVVNAIRAGFAASRDWLGVVVTMADLSDPPARINALVERLAHGADVVAGSRYMAGGRQIGGPPIKGFLSRTAGVTAYFLTGVGIHDVTTNFRAYSRRVVESMPIESKGGFELGLELTSKAHLAGYRVDETPSDWYDRTAGESRFRLFKWLPGYLRWYLRLLFGDPLGLRTMVRRLRDPVSRPAEFKYFGVYDKPGYGWIVKRRQRAVTIVAVDATGGIVLVRQKRPMHRDEESDWELPGGGVEPGESIVAAAARELREETGYLSSAPGEVLCDGLEPIPGMGSYPHAVVRFVDCRPDAVRSPEEDPGIREVAVKTVDVVRREIAAESMRIMPTLVGLYLHELRPVHRRP